MISQAQPQINRPAIMLTLWSPAVALALYFVGGMLPAIHSWLGLGAAHLITNGIYQHTCHQIAARSFFAGDIPFGFCARCTGLYGALAAASFLVVFTRRDRPIPISALVVLCLPTVLDVALDLSEHLSIGNWGRAVCGALAGIAIALFFYPRLIAAVRYSLAVEEQAQ